MAVAHRTSIRGNLAVGPGLAYIREAERMLCFRRVAAVASNVDRIATHGTRGGTVVQVVDSEPTTRDV